MEIVVLTILKDHTSWGSGRDVKDYIKMLKSMNYPFHLISVEMLISDKDEFDRIQKEIEAQDLSNFKLYYYKDDVHISRETRHKDNIQDVRRAMLARIRNKLLKLADLRRSYGVVWIDSDLTYIPPNLLRDCITSGKDIIMPFCGLGDDKYRDYDLNAYKVINGKRVQLKELYSNNPLRKFIEIDSVGGTFLFLKTNVHLDGVLYSETQILNKLNHNVLETEGICLEAQKRGYKCWFINGIDNAILHHSGEEIERFGGENISLKFTDFTLYRFLFLVLIFYIVLYLLI
jgi:Anp1